MDVGIAEEWIGKLESGDFRKGKKALHAMAGTEPDPEKDAFCCLGVLCRMATQDAKWHIRQGAEDFSDRNEAEGRRLVTYDGESGVLPESVAAWAGMKSRTGRIPEEGGEIRDLTNINDASEDFRPVVATIRKYMKEL